MQPVLGREEMMARLVEELGRPPFHALLRPQPVDVDPDAGSVTVRIDADPTLSFESGAVIFHGGVIASLVDMSAHAAVAVRLGRRSPTVDLRIDYLRPAKGGSLVARAVLRKFGRTLATADVEVTVEDRIVALGRGTFIIGQGDRT